MPRYVYRCTECEELSTLSHTSDERAIKCPRCKLPGLVKLLTSFTTQKKVLQKVKTGALTEEFILDARDDLKQQKKKYEDDI